MPSELGICQPEDDLTYMVAFLRTETTMQMLEQQQAEKEMERARGSSNRPKSRP